MEKYFNINQNGMSVKAKIFCEDMRSIKTVVLFGHGFGGHKDNKNAEKLYARLVKRNKGAAVITFNLPCHGDDASPQLRLSVCDSYLSIVLDYIRERIKPEKLFSNANSFGGYLILKYIFEHGNPFDKIVLRCPALTIYDSLRTNIMTPQELEAVEKGRTALVGFDRKVKVTAEFLNDLKEADVAAWDFTRFADDLCILHGTKDEIIDFEASWIFAETNGIEFHDFEGVDHRFTDPKQMDLAIKQTVLFFGLN